MGVESGMIYNPWKHEGRLVELATPVAPPAVTTGKGKGKKAAPAPPVLDRVKLDAYILDVMAPDALRSLATSGAAIGAPEAVVGLTRGQVSIGLADGRVMTLLRPGGLGAGDAEALRSSIFQGIRPMFNTVGLTARSARQDQPAETLL